MSAVSENGIDVTIGDSVTGFIRRTDLSRDRVNSVLTGLRLVKKLMRS